MWIDASTKCILKNCYRVEAEGGCSGKPANIDLKFVSVVISAKYEAKLHLYNLRQK